MKTITENYLRVEYCCLSRIGCVREINEDNFVCDKKINDSKEYGDSSTQGVVSLKSPQLFGVFDGMGGEEHGEVASLIAAQNAQNIKIGNDPVNDLFDLCLLINEKICRCVTKNRLSSMGTTAAMLLFDGDRIIACNIGDSKIFRCSESKLVQISEDHISKFDPEGPGLLTQNLGILPSISLISPFFSEGSARRGDMYLICSDGLTDMISFEEIGSFLEKSDCSEICNAMMDKAIERGAPDNITVVLCRIV